MDASTESFSTDDIDLSKNTPPRGILKSRTSTQAMARKEGETQEEEWSGIVLPRLFSPSSTPSAGILKRRRHLLVGMNRAPVMNSPSPTTAQRRVHFSTTDVCYLPQSDDEDDDEKDGTTPRKRPRLSVVQNGYDTSRRHISASPAASFPERFQIRTNRMVELACAVAAVDTMESLETAETPANDDNDDDDEDNDASVAAVTDDESDRNRPIEPSLVLCTESVESVISHLVASARYRSLTMFLKGRNIGTIGHLASLTESQVQQLPIRQPKIETMRKVLRLFKEPDKPSEEGREVECPTDSESPQQETECQMESHRPCGQEIQCQTEWEPRQATGCQTEAVSQQERELQKESEQRQEMECQTEAVPQQEADCQTETVSGREVECQTERLRPCVYEVECQTESGPMCVEVSSQTDSVSSSVECQTEAQSLREMAACFLTSLQAGRHDHLSRSELRSISRDLMFSLPMIFDRLDNLE